MLHNILGDFLQNTQTAMSALFITCGLLAGSNVANAQEYQMQATASAYHNAGDGYSNHELGGDFTYYFSPVKTAGVPLAEAAFLGRNSNVSAYTFRDINDQDSNGHNIGGEFWFKDLYVDAYSQKNYGQNFYSARVGYMVNDGLLLTLGTVHSASDSASQYAVDAKYVGKLGDHFVGLNAGLVKYQGEYYTSLGGEYFFTPAFSLNASVFTSEVSEFDTRYQVGAKHFFNPQFSVGLQHAKQGSDKTTTLEASFRF